MMKIKKLSDMQIYTLRRMRNGTKYQAQGDTKRARECRYASDGSSDDCNAPSIPALMRLGLVEFDREDKRDSTLYYRVRLTLEGQAAALDYKTKSELANGKA